MSALLGQGIATLAENGAAAVSDLGAQASSAFTQHTFKPGSLA